MKLIQVDDIREWYQESGSLTQFLDSIGKRSVDSAYVENVLGVPLHLYFVAEELRKERAGDVGVDALDSIPFFSLCKGLFLPLSSMGKDKAGQIFGIEAKDPPDTAARQALVAGFLAKEVGLTFSQKIACLLGDPFYGNRGGFRRDSLIRILHRTSMRKQKDVLDRLVKVGDVAVVYAESRPNLKVDPPLSAAEVLETLRLISGRAGLGQDASTPSPFQGESRGEVFSG